MPFASILTALVTVVAFAAPQAAVSQLQIDTDGRIHVTAASPRPPDDAQQCLVRVFEQMRVAPVSSPETLPLTIRRPD